MISTRPIISGFHPDPSVCRVGNTYYLITSSFEYSPGIPIFRSTDLVQWTQIGHVLTRREQLDGVDLRPSGGIYAPTLRHHNGRFWVITTNVNKRPGQILMTAEHPDGPWTDPVRIPAAQGIDPDITWDADGCCWLTWSGEMPVGHQAIVQAELDTSTGELLTEPTVIWRGTGGQFPEGPHLYFVDDLWYLLISEGGTERGHAITVARSESITGPFIPSASNPVLTARGTDWPTQNTGHGDFVQRPDGSWATVFLGARPRGSTPSWHILGRETFAAEVVWVDGWPVVGAPIEPRDDSLFTEAAFSEPSSAVTAPGEAESSNHIPLSIVSAPGLPADWLRVDRGQWTLVGCSDATFVGRRQEHLFMSTLARIGAGASLELRIDPRHRVTVTVEPTAVTAVATIGGKAVDLGTMTVSGHPTVEIRTQPSPELEGTPLNGPDLVVVRVFDHGVWTELGSIDGRYLSTEVAGGFTGRFIGLASGTHNATISLFDYRGSDDYSVLADLTAVDAPSRE